MNYKVIGILVIVLATTSCKTHKYPIFIPTNAQDKPKITSTFEKFDFSAYNVLKQEAKKISTTGKRTTDGLKPQFHESSGYEYYRVVDDKGKIIREIDKNDRSVTVKEYIIPYLAIEKWFYSNGNIKSKIIGSWLGFAVGYYYEYDEKGNLTKAIDLDEGYTFDYNQVLKYCATHNIIIEDKIQYGYHLSIGRRKNESGIPVWIINVPGTEKWEVEYIYLDGKTGEVLKSGKYIKKFEE